MNHEILVSLIVPVFNVEKYLINCLDSIIHQSFFQHIEVILIDDGSTDKSGEICDNYSIRYVNIKTIHQMNSGVSEARNKGIKNAVGKYFMFVDSDDILPKNAIEVLYNAAKESKASIITGSTNIQRSDKSYFLSGPNICRMIKDKKEILNRTIIDLYYSCCGKLFLNNKQICFKSGKKIHEDGFYVFQHLIEASVIMEIPDIVYIYLFHKESSSRSDFSEKYYDILYFMNEKLKIIEEKKFFNDNLSNNIKFKHYLCLLNKMASCHSGYTKKEIYSIRKQVLKYKKKQKLKGKEKIRLVLIQFAFPIYLRIMKKK